MEETLRVWDRSNPRSVYNLVWEELRRALDNLEVIHREWLLLSEREIESKFDPDVLTSQIRISFWKEYTDVQDRSLSAMKMAKVIRGVCSHHCWYEKILNQPKNLVWVMCPPTDYMAAQEEALYYGIRELRRILSRPFIEKRLLANNTTVETVNVGLIKSKIEIVKMLDERVKGAVVQRLAIQQKIESQVNVTNETSMDLNVLEAEIQKVQRSIEGAREREFVLIPEKSEEVLCDNPAMEVEKMQEKLVELLEVGEQCS